MCVHHTQGGTQSQAQVHTYTVRLRLRAAHRQHCASAQRSYGEPGMKSVSLSLSSSNVLHQSEPKVVHKVFTSVANPEEQSMNTGAANLNTFLESLTIDMKRSFFSEMRFASIEKFKFRSLLEVTAASRRRSAQDTSRSASCTVKQLHVPLHKQTLTC